MINWHEGEPFISSTKIGKSFNMELIRLPKGQSNGRYLLKVYVDEYGDAYYSFRYWTKEGQTPWTIPQKISGRKFNGDNIQVFISIDGKLQFFTKENDYKEPCFFVDPGELDIIKEPEKGGQPP